RARARGGAGCATPRGGGGAGPAPAGRPPPAPEARADAARALAHVSDGVVLTGRDGRLVFWNPAAAELLGLDDGDRAGRPLPELVPSWRAATSPGNGGSTAPVVLPVTTGAGERWLSVTSADFGDGVVYALRDVTEEHALETMRSDFLATASHELRTPMTSIYGAARTLLARDGELDAERRVAFLEMIANESERLARIIDEILLASRLDAGDVDFATEPCDAVALARSVLDAAEIRAPRNVELRLAAPSDLPTIACDPNRLRQILLNLVDNAIKYSPEGGEVVLSVALIGEGLRFTVRDNGIGFPADETERIFERFYRVDPELRQGIGGTGLGLYISRELVERMNGRISAESAPGRGSTFAVDLPLAPDAQPHLPSAE
ncbi:MAG: PAS domain-containing protein, partial [Thermoleophilia bacterium]|nr:PAS domain-containing protein [Thermoleophilia bacterium]